MGLFDIDYDILVWRRLPVRWRRAVHYAWLKCLVAPVKYLYVLFTANRNNNLYVTSHNGQVCKLEAVLNDTFDDVDRRITITDGPTADPVYIYLASELKPVYLGLVSEIGGTSYTNPVPLYTDSEANSFGASFIINIPAAVSFDNHRMIALIDFYRLPGRTVYTFNIF